MKREEVRSPDTRRWASVLIHGQSDVTVCLYGEGLPTKKTGMKVKDARALAQRWIEEGKRK